MATIGRQSDVYRALTGGVPGDSAYMMTLILAEWASGVAVMFFIAYRMRNREKREAQNRR